MKERFAAKARVSNREQWKSLLSESHETTKAACLMMKGISFFVVRGTSCSIFTIRVVSAGGEVQNDVANVF